MTSSAMQVLRGGSTGRGAVMMEVLWIDALLRSHLVSLCHALISLLHVYYRPRFSTFSGTHLGLSCYLDP